MIKTPDQRLRVFVSSTLQELAPEREAIKKAILELHLIPVMFELGARPYPPRDLYTAYLQQSHLFIGVYWQQYGWVGPDMTISGIEDEFILSRDMPRLIYLKEPSPARAEGLKNMIGVIQNSNVSYKTFSSIEELKVLVENDLAVLLTERFELSLNPNSGRRLNADELNQQIPAPPTLLIGREREVEEIMEMFGKGDTLITLSGIGGIGKTRVALEVARQMKNKGALQVCFVPLDAIDHAEDVPAAILRRAFPEAQSTSSPVKLLVELIGDKEVLLVFDNFEQIIPAHTVVSELLQHCPKLKVLVTSREVLRISGEVEYAMRPLEIDQPGSTRQVPAFEELSPAVKLFVNRTRSFRPDFKLMTENYDAIVRICYALDGIPLAIELAAARLRLFSPVQLLPRLEKRFDLLKTQTHDIPARHQTLKATIDWSFNLLTRDEQKLLCILSVFNGGCSMEAVGAVAHDNPVFKEVWKFPRKSFYLADEVEKVFASSDSEIGTLELVESLLAKSLAYTSVNKFGTLRINFYQTIIQYCRERLAEFGLQEEAYRRHLTYFLYLAESNWAHLRAEDAAEIYELFDNDIDNMTSALDWSVKHDPHTGLRLAVALAEYWDTRGKSDEAVKWLKILIATVEKKEDNSCEKWLAQLELARSQFRLTQYEDTWNLAKQAAEYARAHNDLYLLTDAVCIQSMVNVYAFRNENKEALLAEGNALARQLDYKMMMLDLAQHEASDKITAGMIPEGIQLSEVALKLAEELNARRWQAISHTMLGFAYTWSGNPEKGEASFRSCLECSRHINDQMMPLYGLLGCSQVALMSQNIPRALTLLGVVQAYAQRPGTVVPMLGMQMLTAITDQANMIPAEMREPLLAEGKKLHLDEAIQMVLKPEVSTVAAG